MALIGNGSVLLKSPGRFVGGVYPGGERAAAWDGSPSRLRGQFVGGFAATASIPSGYAPGRAWSPPLTAGAIKAVGTAELATDATAALTGGRNGVATTALTLDAEAIGGLVAGLVAVVALATTASAEAAGAAAGAASAAASVTASATAGALAHLAATVSAAVTASAEPTGIGHAAAVATSYTELSVEGMREAVWATAAAAYNAPGTMGELLNAAGSGGLSSEFQTILRELYRLAGLDPTKPLVVTSTSRRVPADGSDIDQTISESSGTVTVTRST